MNSDIKFYITESLFSLLKNKEIKEIKVTEIVNLSNVSRTTFYNNFKNINSVLDYKFNLLVSDIFSIYNLNKLRNKNNTELLKNIITYINKNKNTFILIKNKFYFEFKKVLDNYFISNLRNINEYYIKSGIIINLCIAYLDNNIVLDKIKID